jgi:hypothetical protein
MSLVRSDVSPCCQTGDVPVYARLTKAKMKPGARQDLLAVRQAIDPIVKSLVGLQFCLSLAAADDELVLIAVYDSKPDVDEAMDDAREIWQRAAHLLDGEPSFKTYEVLKLDAPEP